MKKRSENHQTKKGKKKAPKERSAKSIDRLNQELQTHQIELELQNEELRLSQSLLEESRNKYSALYDFAPIGYFTLDPNGLILEVNLKGSELLQIKRERLVKTPFLLYIAKGDRRKFYAYQKKILKKEGAQKYEIELRRRDDSSIQAEVHCMLVQGPSGRPLYLTVVNDITDRRRSGETLAQETTKAEQGRRLESEFISVISHELRTPLHAVIGYTDLLLNATYGAIRPEQADPLKGVLKNAQDLLSLTDNLLDLSRIETEEIPIRLQLVDIPSLLKEAVAGVKPLAKRKSLGIRWILSDDLPAIESDPCTLSKIATHLLSNAVKFTAKGTITISTRNVSDRNGIEMLIQDTGIGIPPEKLNKIFNPFYQVHSGLVREFDGAGLGLAIVKGLLNLLKGEVHVQSDHGKSSIFTIFLPYRFHSSPHQ